LREGGVKQGGDPETPGGRVSLGRLKGGGLFPLVESSSGAKRLDGFSPKGKS